MLLEVPQREVFDGINGVEPGSQTLFENTIHLTRQDLERMLFQSGEMLLPDEVDIAGDGMSAHGNKLITGDESYVKNHGDVMMGVMQGEFAQQIGLALLLIRYPELSVISRKIAIQTDVIFKPGETMACDLQIVSDELLHPKNRGRLVKAEAKVYHLGQPQSSFIEIETPARSKALMQRIMRNQNNSGDRKVV